MSGVGEPDNRLESSAVRQHARETRYSLQQILEEVRQEREESVMGRELLDATEISKMFSKRILKKKR